MDQRTIEANRRQQAELYGRPLGDLVAELTRQLSLSQARLAETLGLSAPMLSQLASGQRIKIGNPQAVARLQALLDLAPRVETLTPEQRQAALADVAARATTITGAAAVPPDLAVTLASVGTPDALRAAGDAAAPHSAALAALLRQAADAGGPRG